MWKIVSYSFETVNMIIYIFFIYIIWLELPIWKTILFTKFYLINFKTI